MENLTMKPVELVVEEGMNMSKTDLVLKSTMNLLLELKRLLSSRSKEIQALRNAIQHLTNLILKFYHTHLHPLVTSALSQVWLSLQVLSTHLKHYTHAWMQWLKAEVPIVHSLLSHYSTKLQTKLQTLTLPLWKLLSLTATCASNRHNQRVALSLFLWCLFLGYLWALTTGVVLGTLFRKPLGKMGLRYRNIKFLPLRLAVMMTHVEASPTDCNLGKAILQAILPSADLVTDVRSYHHRAAAANANATHNPHAHTHTHAHHVHFHHPNGPASTSTSTSPQETRFIPKGSTIHIEYISLSPSCRLWRMRPFYYLLKMRDRVGKQDSFPDFASTSPPHHPSSPTTTSTLVTLLSNSRKFLSSIPVIFRICIPLPVLKIEFKGMTVDIEKVYLGPRLPSAWRRRRRSEFSSAAADADLAAPSSVLAMSLLKSSPTPMSAPADAAASLVSPSRASNAAPRPATNAATRRQQNPSLLPHFDRASAVEHLTTRHMHRANAITFFLEKWLLHELKQEKNMHPSNNNNNHRQGHGRRGSESLFHEEESFLSEESGDVQDYDGDDDDDEEEEEDSEYRRRRPPPNNNHHHHHHHHSQSPQDQDEEEDETRVQKLLAEDTNNPASNGVLQTAFSMMLSAIRIRFLDFQLVVRGAHAVQVAEAREKLSPELAALRLASQTLEERGMTVLKVKKLSFGFHGFDSDLIAKLAELQIMVGSPVQSLSRGGGGGVGGRAFRPRPRSFQERVRIKRMRKMQKAELGGLFDARREWHVVVSKCNGLMRIAGVLDIAVWATGYDHHWDKRALSLSLTVTGLKVNLQPEALHTVLVHFDDFLDANSPYHEWFAWYERGYSVRPLSDEERELYRRWYRTRRKLNRQQQQQAASPTLGDTAVLDESNHGSVLSTGGQALSTSLTTAGGAVGEEKEEECTEEAVLELEKRMTYLDILLERRASMGALWNLPYNSDELNQFIFEHGSNGFDFGGVGPAQPCTNIHPPSSPQTQQQTLVLSADMMSTSFDGEGESTFEGLLALLEEKFRLLSPLFTFSLMLPVVTFDVPAELSLGLPSMNAATTGAVDFDSDASSVSSDVPMAKTRLRSEFDLHELDFKYQSRSALLSRRPKSAFLDVNAGGGQGVADEREKGAEAERLFQRMVLSIHALTWLIVEGDRSIPTFLNEEMCGLLYKHPHGDPDRPTLVIDLCIAAPTYGNAAGTTSIVFQLMDVLSVVQPFALSSSLNTITKALMLPARCMDVEELRKLDASFSEEAMKARQTLAGRGFIEVDAEVTRPRLASSTSEGTSRKSTSMSEDADQVESANGTLLNGMLLDVNVDICNVSAVFLMSDNTLNKGTMELNLGQIKIDLDSEEMKETLEFDTKDISVTACLLFTSADIGRYAVLLRTLPLKESIVLDDIRLHYDAHVVSQMGFAMDDKSRGTTLLPRSEHDNASLRTDTMRRDGRNQRKNLFNVVAECRCSIGTLIMNATPTFNAVLSGSSKSIVSAFSAPADKKEEEDIETQRARLYENEKQRILETQRAAFLGMWNKFDVDNSNSLNKDEIKELCTEILEYAQTDPRTFKPTGESYRLTSKEFDRELVHMQQLAELHGGDISFEEMDNYIFKQHLDVTGEDVQKSLNGEQFMDSGYQFSQTALRGVVYYDDLREYASTVESYRITGSRDPTTFPPISAWKSSWNDENGVELFWDLYERETGCTRKSLNGQDVTVVQGKLVRSLCNYEFAKYCWKILVRPSLQASSSQSKLHVGRRTGTRDHGILPTLTDWVLDSDTKCKVASRGFSSGVRHWADDQRKAEEKNPSSNLSDPYFVYDVKLTFELRDVVFTVGNALAFTKPLLAVNISDVNLSSDSLLHSNTAGHFVAAVPQQEVLRGPPTRNRGALAEEKKAANAFASNARVHFEVTLSVDYLNTKHDVFEVLVEPFSLYGDVSLTAPRSVFDSILGTGCDDMTSREARMSKSDISATLNLKCPSFLSMNTAPSLFQTANLLRDILVKTSWEQYQALANDRMLESLEEHWAAVDVDLSGFLDRDEVASLMRRFIAARNLGTNEDEVAALSTKFLDDVDENADGMVSFAELRSAFRSRIFSRGSSIFDSASKIRLHNVTGQDIMFCTVVAYHESNAEFEILASDRRITLELDESFLSTLRTRKRRELDMLMISISRFELVENVPISAFQTVIIPLVSPQRSRTLAKTSEKDSKRKSRDLDKFASGFEPSLTLVPITDNLDSVTIEVRSSFVVEAHTPIDVRVLRISASYLRKRYRGRGFVDFRKKSFPNILQLLSEGALVVFEAEHVSKGSKVPLPLNVMTSSSSHMLLVRDSEVESGGAQKPWRAPVLLTKDFLFNTSGIPGVDRYHARAGISIQRDRLNVYDPLMLGQTAAVSKAKRQTAWDTAIQVLPTFRLTNGLPFSVRYRCWQLSREEDDGIWRQSGAGEEEVDESSESSSDEQLLLASGSRYTDGMSSYTGKRDENAKRHTALESNAAFSQNGSISEGCDVIFNGINMRDPLFIQISQDIFHHQVDDEIRLEGDLSRLCWTYPIKLSVDKLQAGGNASGALSLPFTTAPLGDEVDISLETVVERNGVIDCTIYSPYWIMNKSGFKMEFKFTGRDETTHDSGVGGLPILAHSSGETTPFRVAKREISAIPLERASDEVASVWWNRRQNGDLVLNPPKLKENGKALVRWSEKVGLDAVGMVGEISCGEVILGVSIDTLTGAFHRSNLISFVPRFMIRNEMHVGITILPLVGHKQEILKFLKLVVAYPDELKHFRESCTYIMPGQWTALFNFQHIGPTKLLPHSRYICMQVDEESNQQFMGKWHMISPDSNGVQYFMERYKFSGAIAGMVSVSCDKPGAASMFKIRPCSRPPLRVENRSNEHYLFFVQDDPDGKLVEIPPMTWCGYTWDNPHGKRAVRFVALNAAETMHHHRSKSCIEDNEGESGFVEPTPFKSEKTFRKTVRQYLFSGRSRTYNPWKVGEKQRLPCAFEENRSPNEWLCSEVRIIGGSRVLSFNDSKWRAEQLELGHLRSGGNWKNVSVDVALEGLTINLADDFPHEILCFTVREITLFKPTGHVDMLARVRHMQLDAMHDAARYPIILRPLHVGVDRRSQHMHSTAGAVEGESVGQTMGEVDLAVDDVCYWRDGIERPLPVFEASLSYLPQPYMLFIPNVSVFICPLKVQVELDYVLRVVDLVLNSLPEEDPEQVRLEIQDTLRKLNSPALTAKHVDGEGLPSYFEKISISPTWIELELDIKPEDNETSHKEDADVEGHSILALSSLGKTTKSALSASLLTWVTNVAATFAHVTPTFRFPELVKVNSYCYVEEMVNELTQFYVTTVIYQSYKVLFSMHVFGDPKQLVGQLQTGVVDFVTITYDEILAGGEIGFGKGVQSLVKNVVGGTFSSLGKLTGSFADILDLATNEESSSFKPGAITTARGPDHIGEGIMQGTLYFTFAITRGVTGLIDKPYRGIKERSPTAFCKGIVKGAVGLGVSPIAGVFGFTAKISDGISATTQIFESSMIEARVRPARNVGWGGMMGRIGLPYLKAIGIRVHLVRYQKRRSQKDVSAGGHVTSSGSTVAISPTEPNIAKRRRIPSRRVMVVRHPKGKYTARSIAASPMLLRSNDGQSSDCENYVLAFEDTIQLRDSDLQLSDTITLELWRRDRFAYSYARKRLPDGKCTFTLSEIQSSMEGFFRAQQAQKILRLTQLSSAVSEEAEEDTDGIDGGDGGAPKKLLPVQKAYQEVKSLNDRHFPDLATHREAVDQNEVVAPPLQEFALIKPTRARSRRKQRDLLADIQSELLSIKSRTEDDISSEGSFWSSSDDSLDSLDDDYMNYGDDLDRNEAKSRSKNKESGEIYGYATVSFVPLSW